MKINIEVTGTWIDCGEAIKLMAPLEDVLNVGTGEMSDFLDAILYVIEGTINNDDLDYWEDVARTLPQRALLIRNLRKVVEQIERWE